MKKILAVLFVICAIVFVWLHVVNNRNEVPATQAQNTAEPVPLSRVEQDVSASGISGKFFQHTSNVGNTYRIEVDVRSGLSDQKQHFEKPVVTNGTNMFPSFFAMQGSSRKKLGSNDWNRIQAIRATATNLPPLRVAPVLGE